MVEIKMKYIGIKNKNIRLLGIWILELAVLVYASTSQGRSSEVDTQKPVINNQNSTVLGAASTTTLNVNIPSYFNDTVTFEKDITASNVIYSVTPGIGISVSGSQDLTISNSGVLSLNNQRGDLTLSQGSGISISDLIIANSDSGSSQNIFKNISVPGQPAITAGSNSDTLTLANGAGISFAVEGGEKIITLSPDTSAINVSGWQHSNGLTYAEYLVGINTAPSYYNLNIDGTEHATGATTIGGNLLVSGLSDLLGSLNVNGNVTFGNSSGDSISILARIADGTSIIPANDIGADLGTESLRFNNLYVANLNSNTGFTSAGQAVFTYSPIATGYTEGSIIINPTSPVANGLLLATGIGGYQNAGFDAEGDLLLGYSSPSNNPIAQSTNNPMNIYGHNETIVASIDTSGNLVTAGSLDINGANSAIAGSLNVSTITSSGTLSLSPASNLNVSITNGSQFTVNNNQLTVDSSTGHVGIGTASAQAALDVAALSGTDGVALTNSGTKVLGISYGSLGATIDMASADPTNLLSNSNFASDLAGWNYIQPYTLDDEFSDTLPAGSVNGTPSTPLLAGNGVGTRTADINPSISGGILTSPTYPTGADHFPLGYSGLSSMFATGKIFSANSTISTNAGFSPGYGVGWLTGGSIIFNGGITQVAVDNADTTNYLKTAIIARSAGAYYFKYLGGVWKLYFQTPTGSWSGNNAFYQFQNALSVDYIHVPTATFLPTPLAYDTFTRADGALGTSETTGPDGQATPGLSWTGSTWTISGGKAINTPTLGSEMTIDGGLEIWNTSTDLANWTEILNGTSTITQDSIVFHGGVNSVRMDIDGASSLAFLRQVIPTTVNSWHQITFYVKSDTSATYEFDYQGSGCSGGAGSICQQGPATNSFQQKLVTVRTNTASTILNVRNVGSPGRKIYFDDFADKTLTLSELFSSITTSASDIVASTEIINTTVTQSGLVLNLDSASNPQNFVLVYLAGTVDNGTTSRIFIEKIVNGTYTTLQATTVTYVAGATLRVTKDGTKYRVYYNNALVGSEQTINDASIINNTKHGLFSTYSGNQLDNFTLFPRGTGGEYSDIPAEDLAVTRDTGVTYNGAAASAKLVAGGNNANFTQNVTLPDTNTYTLTAYAYTGSAVTSSDLQLYYGSEALTTNFSYVKGDWYKLQANVTGITSSQPVGVRVKAGKTVYVSNFSLASGTGATSTLFVDNMGTGTAGLDVQSTTTLHTGMAGSQALIVKGSLSQSSNLTEWTNSTGGVLASINANGLLNATTSGVATFVKSGTISDADFTNPVDGMVAVDATDGRIYFRAGGVWSFVAKTGGFQIPADEVINSGLSVSDLLIPYVESLMSDGVMHGLWAKASNLTDTLFADEAARIKVLEKNNNTFENAKVLGLTTITDAIVTGSLSLQGMTLQGSSVTALNPVNFNAYTIDLMNGALIIDSSGNLDITKGVISGNESVRGSEIIESGQVSVTVDRSWTVPPTSVIVTPRFNAKSWITDKDKNGFTINIPTVSSQDIAVDWVAVW